MKSKKGRHVVEQTVAQYTKLASDKVYVVSVNCPTTALSQQRSRLLTTSTVILNYVIHFDIKTQNQELLETRLLEAVDSGNFTTGLAAYATASNLAGFNNVTVSFPSIAIIQFSSPTNQPTNTPSTVVPSVSPTTLSPTTSKPSFQPLITNFPTRPSVSPTYVPSALPSVTPTKAPTVQPSYKPTSIPTYYPTAQPTGQPTSQPTSSPSCGVGRVHTKDGVEKGQCGPCPPGTYDPFPGSPLCTVCPLDFYQSEAGQTSCNRCPYPQRTESTESASCPSFGFVVNTVTLICVLTFIAGIFLLGLWTVSDSGEMTEEQLTYWIHSRKAAVFLNLVVPTLDAITNFAYLLSQRFFRPYLFYLSVLFTFHSVVVFSSRIFRLYALPMSPIRYCNKFFVLGFTTSRREQDRKHDAGILTDEDVARRPADDFPLPTIGGYIFCPISCYQHGNLFLVVWEIVGWGFAFAIQSALSVFMFTYPLFLIVWLIVGMLLQVTKILAVGRVWNFWFRVWTGDETYSIPSDIIVDTEDFNGSQLIQFLFESIPQLIVQLFNSLYSHSLDNLGILSIVTSGFMVINGLYVYIYYRYFFKSDANLGLKDVPLDKTIEIDLGVLNVHINLVYARIDNQRKNFSKLTKVQLLIFIIIIIITDHHLPLL